MLDFVTILVKEELLCLVISVVFLLDSNEMVMKQFCLPQA